MFAGVILASLAFSSGSQPKAGEAAYEFKLNSDDNSIVAIKEKNRTVFVVTGCITGSAIIKLKGGQWPENVTLRFQHDKETGFSNLEHITLTTDRVYAEGSLSRSGQFSYCFLDPKRTKPEVLDARRAAGTMKVLVESRAGAIEVTLPAHLLTGSSQLDLYWIAAYLK